MSSFRSGFCVLAGRPNVGKSTLLNAMVGTKIAIVSPRPQTTRNRIVGVCHGDGYQIVFIDTPGFHRPKHRLGQHMMKTATATVSEADVVALVVDVSVPVGPGDKAVADVCKRAQANVIVVGNKVDLSSDLGRDFNGYGDMGFPIVICSAKTGQGIDNLVQALYDTLPEGPEYYPEDMVTDEPERQLVSELVREGVLHLTRDEVPHSVAVRIEEFAERAQGLIYVSATVLVERKSQRGIIIGAGGAMLKEIGKRARKEIEALLGTKVYLDLWVKVAPKWRNKERILSQLGYDRR